MTTQFSPKLSEILAYSREEAARLASRSVGPEHLLLGILRTKEGPVIDLFKKLDLNLQAVKTELEQRVREDEIGTPFCICVDFDTETDGCVTVRDRDTMEQVRIPVSEVRNYIEERLVF